jgi:hypothetical protein
MKVKAIWEFDADVSDISSEYIDIEGWAKQLAKDELNNMLLNFELSGDDFQYEVVKESPEDEPADKRIRETIKRHYKDTTDQLFLLREAFKESGFTDEEAFKLTENYVRHSIMDDMRRNTKPEVLERYKRINQRRRELLNKENQNDQT